MISSAGTEGINLRNVRQIHIMEPHWNEIRIDQTIGRGIRLCSHSDLSVSDRYVDVFRYFSVRDDPRKKDDFGNVKKITTDIKIK